MGSTVFDRYSVLHFLAGMVPAAFGVPLVVAMLAHVVFELVENTRVGMCVINRHMKSWWPGGKDEPDEFVNTVVGDNLSFYLGWLAGHYWRLSYLPAR